MGVDDSFGLGRGDTGGEPEAPRSLSPVSPRAVRPRGITFDPEGGFSKTAGLVVAILTIVSIICGAVFWVVHQNDMLQTQVAVLQQEVSANSDGLKTLNEKRNTDEENFNRMILLVTRLHDRR